MKNLILYLFMAIVAASCGSREERTAALLPHSIKTGHGEEQARGFIFHDASKNRLMDPSEKGIAGVAVSNGTALVQTNGDRTFTAFHPMRVETDEYRGNP